MSLFEKLSKKYTIAAKCPNCGFGTKIRIPKGTSVADFVKGGKCKCDECSVMFIPEEYTTSHFEEEKMREKNKDKIVKPKATGNFKPFKDYSEKKEEIKWM
jgi:hypothetical protein